MEMETIVEKLGEGFEALKRVGTLQDDQEQQIIQWPGSSQRLSQKLKSTQGLVRVSWYICSSWLPCLTTVEEDAPNL